MKKLKMKGVKSNASEKGCNKYREYWWQRNSRYVHRYKIQAIKVDKNHIETYSDQELQLLLIKPNIKKCKFIEYQSWVMTNFLFTIIAILPIVVQVM